MKVGGRSLAVGSLMTISGILVSRFSGLAREVAFGYAFGTSLLFDAFVIAFRLPNALRALIAEGAFTVALVPKLRAARALGNEPQIIGHVGITWALVLVLLSIVAAILAPFWVAGMPGIDTPQMVETTVALTRLMCGYVWLVGMYGFALGVCQARKIFFAPAAAPVAMNIAMAGAAVASWYLGADSGTAIRWLGISVLVGGAWQLAICIPAMLSPRPQWIDLRTAFRDLWTVLRTAAPATIGVGTYQVQVLVLTSLASGLGDGKVSSFFFADRLLQLPLAVIGIALGSTALPYLADAARHSVDRFSMLLGNVLVVVIAVATPIALALAILAPMLVRLIYQHGAFDSGDTSVVSGIVVAASFGIVAASLNRVVAAGHYAHQDTLRPTVISVFGAFVLVGAGYVLQQEFGTVGLATALSITPWAQFMLNLRLLRGRYHWRPQHLKGIAVVLLACLGLFAGVAMQAGTVWQQLGYVSAGSIFYVAVVLFAARSTGGWRQWIQPESTDVAIRD